MKTRILAAFTLLLFVFTACENSVSETIDLSVPETSFDVGAQATTLTVDVFSNSTWTVSSNSSWCTPDILSGENDGQVILTVTANDSMSERTATVVVTAGKLDKKVVVTQEGATTN